MDKKNGSLPNIFGFPFFDFDYEFLIEKSESKAPSSSFSGVAGRSHWPQNVTINKLQGPCVAFVVEMNEKETLLSFLSNGREKEMGEKRYKKAQKKKLESRRCSNFRRVSAVGCIG
jgi:hypothetical protein